MQRPQITWNKVRLATGLAAVALVIACASKLDPIKEDRSRKGSEQAVDWSAIHFFDLRSNSDTTVAAYMKDHGKDHLLLIFGSMNCAVCNEKNVYLRDNIVGKSDLFLTGAGKSTELIGVNTDPEKAKSEVLEFISEREFSFIHWMDPAAKAMVDYFLPAGASVGIPFSAFINERGIKWVVTNAEHVDVPTLLERVARTLAEENGNTIGKTPTPVPTARPTPTSIPAKSDLFYEGPGRLGSVDVSGCGLTPTRLDAVMGDTDYRFVQVDRGNCGADCKSNVAELTAAEAACTANGKSCSTMSLTQADPDASLCGGGKLQKTSLDFFATFRNLFDWSYPRRKGAKAGSVVMDDVAGPMTLGFNRSGTIVFAQEGKLKAGQLSTAVSGSTFGERVRGTDFPFYTAGRGEFQFADLRQQSKYTVIGTIMWNCSGCRDVLAEYSDGDNIGKYCRANPDTCQFFSNVGDLDLSIEAPISAPDLYNVMYANFRDPGNFGQDAHVKVITSTLLIDTDAKYLNDEKSYTSFIGGFGKSELYRINPSPAPEAANPEVLVFDREGKLVLLLDSDPGRPDAKTFSLIKDVMK